jgi:hypothetical protein
MASTENAPLEALFAKLNEDSEHAPSNEGHRQKRGRTYRSSDEVLDLGNDEPFRSDKPPIGSRGARTVAFFLFAALVGAGAALIVFPPVGWLSPVSTTKAPVPSVNCCRLAAAA